MWVTQEISENAYFGVKIPKIGIKFFWLIGIFHVINGYIIWVSLAPAYDISKNGQKTVIDFFTREMNISIQIWAA